MLQVSPAWPPGFRPAHPKNCPQLIYPQNLLKTHSLQDLPSLPAPKTHQIPTHPSTLSTSSHEPPTPATVLFPGPQINPLPGLTCPTHQSSVPGTQPLGLTCRQGPPTPAGIHSTWRQCVCVCVFKSYINLTYVGKKCHSSIQKTKYFVCVLDSQEQRAAHPGR